VEEGQVPVHAHTTTPADIHIPAVRRQGPTSLRLGKANPRSMACLLLLLAVLVCRADDDEPTKE